MRSFFILSVLIVALGIHIASAQELIRDGRPPVSMSPVFKDTPEEFEKNDLEGELRKKREDEKRECESHLAAERGKKPAPITHFDTIFYAIHLPADDFREQGIDRLFDATIYQASIYGDGRVESMGTSGVKAIGGTEYKISRKKVAMIVAAINSAGYQSVATQNACVGVVPRVEGTKASAPERDEKQDIWINVDGKQYVINPANQAKFIREVKELSGLRSRIEGSN